MKGSQGLIKEVQQEGDWSEKRKKVVLAPVAARNRKSKIHLASSLKLPSNFVILKAS